MYSQRCTNAGILQSTTGAELIDTGSTLYIHCRERTFYTVGIGLGQLFTNIVPTSVINSRSLTLDQDLTDRYSWQSVMISAWAADLINKISFPNIFSQ